MDDTKDLVSVILPTYNRLNSCKDAVESALTQTYGNIEVIVVDDGSTDETGKIIPSLDPRIKYIYQTNAGVSTARNTALQIAKGEYIAFLDSDDIWLPWKLTVQLEVLNAFPEAGMVWSDMKSIDEKGTITHDSYLKLMYGAYKFFDREKDFSEKKLLRNMWKECPEEFKDRKCYSGNIFSWMFMGNLIHTSTVLLRRSIQRKVGFFDVHLTKSGEDYDFHFRTCRTGEVAFMDIPTILYRVGAADQLTNEDNMIWIARNNLKTIQKMLSIARDEIVLPASLMRQKITHSHAWIGITGFDEDRKSARRHLLKSLSLNPFQGRIAAFFILSFLPDKIVKSLREYWSRRKL